MRIKHALACRRPIEYSPQVQPMILTPSHGSLPSGHSTKSFTAAIVLWSLLRDAHAKPHQEDNWGSQLMRQAARVAINRTVAGVHFPVDSATGAVLGLTLGHYLVKRCTSAADAQTYTAWKFDGTRYPIPPDYDGDFYWDALYDVGTRTQTPTAYATPAGDQTLQPQETVLTWLWRKALAEWT